MAEQPEEEKKEASKRSNPNWEGEDRRKRDESKVWKNKYMNENETKGQHQQQQLKKQLNSQKSEWVTAGRLEETK